MTVLLRTHDHAAADRRAFWQDVVCDSFVPVHVEPLQDEPFRGQIAAGRLGAVRVAEVSADPSRVDRTARLIARSDAEYLLVGVVQRGSAVVRQDGRETALGPGDIACYDTSRPYTLVCRGDFAMLEFMFPHRLAHLDSSRSGEVTATRFSAADGVGALVSPFLTRLAGHSHEYAENAETLSRTAGDLLATLFAERRPPRPDDDRQAVRRTTLLRVRAYIDQHLADPDLSPEQIAKAHHVSLRYLQKLFSEERTTVTAWIRQRRLEGCRRDLAGPYAAGRTVAATAARWGFLNPAHFSRVFKAAYGVSPGDYRAAHLAQGRSSR
ncbi:helix-turn-helix domain-containing protein [Streptomyces morookaense]|uniref:Helix-turn-helix domain-containing protein n=1 Tax=Streptomyces morookaense TaxID=1970 RepID=A0A7Y7B1Y1_STRMO|nr:helix-turn-helix domain-containing protein [Streptomyces morookaense]NVK77126.1 helix-turn-helix domain-containing protein [Streptomyces morookaense]GHF24173.1 AraC family transcriptional regulator [Streptomyces morookaense]